MDSAYEILEKILFSKSEYYSLLENLHNKITPVTYLEIGIGSGKSLSLAKTNTKVIGIDPNPLVHEKINSKAKIYPKTSDDFFDNYDLFEEFNENHLDFAFIDQLHLFEQDLKDFINIENYSNEETVLLIHDCIPN